jgi:cell division protein ZapE
LLTLDELIGALPGRPDIETLTRGFVPPLRFRGKRFGNYDPRHPTQAAAAVRLARFGDQLATQRSPGFLPPFLRSGRSPGLPYGIYIDGGFGVGKTHLLAALWHAVPAPAAYLTFDELMYFVGMVGAEGVADAFRDHRLVAVDEWELDDPGNLKMAIAVGRRLISGRTCVAVTSNTLPLDLGVGRFSQKDFRGEIEELAASFEVVRIEGDDFRQRHFEGDPDARLFLDSHSFDAVAATAPDRGVRADLPAFVTALRQVHPIRYRELVTRVDALLVERMGRIQSLADALRWVHFIDSVYDAGIPFTASGEIPLGELFEPSALEGAFGKKLARCLSRLEEMMGETGLPAGTGIESEREGS